jgi:hypothetical protein
VSMTPTTSVRQPRSQPPGAADPRRRLRRLWGPTTYPPPRAGDMVLTPMWTTSPRGLAWDRFFRIFFEVLHA